MKYRAYKKHMTKQRKSVMKTTEDDLKGLIKAAVKEALEGSEDDSKDEEIVLDDISDIVADAIDAVNEKRKSSKEDPINDDVAAEILEALNEGKTEGEEGEEKDEDTIDIADAIAQAVETINEKRKSSKEDPIGEADTEEIVNAVTELIEEAAGEGKGSKADPVRRQLKYVRTPSKSPVQRKYSNIYMNNGGNMDKKKAKKAIPTPVLMARAIKCMDVWGGGDPEKAAHYAEKKYNDGDMAKEFKALSATVGSEGGYLIPEVYADQIIELLYPKTVIFELGAQKVPLTNGNLNIPKMTAGARATWGGEKRKIETSNPTFGNIKLSAKRLQAIIPQTKELLMSSSYSADQMFANDLMRRMQLGLDYGAFYGTGGEFQPLGIMNNKKIEMLDAKKLEKGLVDDDGNITSDLPVFMRSKAFMKNIDDSSAGWVMNSMLEGIFMNMKTSTGAYIYRDEMISGKLLGFPYKISNQIAVKDKMTDLVFGNWSDMLVGDQMGLETYTTLDGSWTDENGVTHNAFDENMTATRATMYDDIGVRHEESFLRVTNIKVE